MAVTTLAGLVLLGIVALADPGHIGPMFADPVPKSIDWMGLAPALGFIGIVVGSIWMYRIVRDEPEPHVWRSRSGDYDVDREAAAARLALHDVDPDDAGGLTPGQRGRWIGRAMIAGACVAIASVAYLYVEITSASSPMFRTPPDLFGLPVGDVMSMVGLVGAIVGVLWMIRIHRADPEPDQHAWRYRSRDR